MSTDKSDGKMVSAKYLGYAIAAIVALTYAAWYLISGALLSLSPATSPIFPLTVAETVSAILVFIVARGRFKAEKFSDLKYPIISAMMYAIGNFISYIVIISNGVPSASAFGTAEIVVFTFLIWLSSRRDINMAMYSFAALIIAAGLVFESLVVQNGLYSLNATLVGLGLLIMTFYGVATYMYYLSVKHIKNSFTTMFFVQAPQAVIYLATLFLFIPSSSLPSLSSTYTILAIVVGAVLFGSFYAETLMMKVLNMAGGGAVATGYIISDMQLIPIVIYFLIVNPGSWQTYAPGLLLVTVGLALLDWK